MTTQPMAPAVPPVRKTSASSIQSPTARPCPRESGGRKPPGSSSCRRCWPGPAHPSGPDAGQPVGAGPDAGPGWPTGSSPALATRRWSSKTKVMRSESLRGSIYWVLLVWGRFGVSKAIIPEAREHFLTPSTRPSTHLFGGLRLKVPNIPDSFPERSIGQNNTALIRVRRKQFRFRPETHSSNTSATSRTADCSE